MAQRHEHLPTHPPQLRHLLANLGVAALVAFLHQPLEDPLRRVPLLLRKRLVRFEDLDDPLHERPYLRLRIRRFTPIPRRLAVRQDLLQRLVRDPFLPAQFALAEILLRRTHPQFRPPFHVPMHPFASGKRPCSPHPLLTSAPDTFYRAPPVSAAANRASLLPRCLHLVRPRQGEVLGQVLGERLPGRPHDAPGDGRVGESLRGEQEVVLDRRPHGDPSPQGVAGVGDERDGVDPVRVAR